MDKSRLLSDEFFNDEAVKHAFNVVLDRLADYQKKVTGVQGAKAHCRAGFAKLMTVVEQTRGSLYFPYLSAGLGHGPYVECADGSIKLDFISGIGVHWSHGDRHLVASSLHAALHDTIMQGNLMQHSGSVALFQKLVSYSGLDAVFLTSSGAMGVENALKLCFQQRFPARRVLAFSNCFCGRTLATASITDKPHYRQGLPAVLDVDYLPFYDPKRPQESTQDAVAQLKTYLNRYPDAYACMKFELIQGEGGFNVGSRSFFVAIMDILKEAGIPIYIDETQTFGRTTSLFAYQMFGLADYVDIVSIGKLSQVCATLYRESFRPKPGLISQTFTSSTAAIEAAKVIVDQLVHQNYLGKTGKIARLHGYFCRKFRALQRHFPAQLGPVRGVGSMIAYSVYDGSMAAAVSFVKACYEAGLMGFVAGRDPAYVRYLLPIGGVSADHIDESLDIVKYVLKTHAK